MTDPILITGASRGLGAALAEALSPTAHIVAVSRTTGALEELDDRIRAQGRSVTLAPMDITQPDAMATLCRSIHGRWGSLSLWLHCAIHAAPLSPVPSIDTRDWQKSVAVNVSATACLIACVAPLLRANSQAIFFEDPCVGDRFFGAYGGTKAGQIALARSWAAETTRIGPRVRILVPRPMPTATRARFFPGEDRTALATPADEARRLVAQLQTS